MQTIEMTVSAQTQRRRRKRRSKFSPAVPHGPCGFCSSPGSFFGLLTFQQLAPGFPAEKLPSPSGPSFWSISGTVSGPG